LATVEPAATLSVEVDGELVMNGTVQRQSLHSWRPVTVRLPVTAVAGRRYQGAGPAQSLHAGHGEGLDRICIG